MKIFLNNEEGIRLGKLVSDEYLDYMYPELKDMSHINCFLLTNI